MLNKFVFWITLCGFSLSTLIHLETGTIPEINAGIPLDKVIHTLGFGWLTYFAMRAYAERVSFIIVGLFLYGLLIEALQAVGGHRTAEGADVIANSVGISLGFMVGTWIPKNSRSCRSDSR